MIILGQLGGVPHPEQVDALQPGVVVDNILICLLMDHSKVRIVEKCVVIVTLLNIAFTVNIPMAILGRNVLATSPSRFMSMRSRPPLVGALRPHRPSLVVTPVQEASVLVHLLFLTS